jgi:ligand-binding sensor domain-containing protein
VNKPFFLALLFVKATCVVGQLPHFQTHFLQKKNEEVEVNAILQNKDGYVLVGTDKGLFQLDGHSKTQLAKTDSVGGDQVTALAQDAAGKVWCGHKNGKISILDKNVITFFSPPEGLSTKPISDMLFDKDGVLWFSTLNDGIYFLLDERLFRIDEQEGLPDLFVYDLEEDQQGRIWAGTDAGIAICSRQEKTVAISMLNSKNGLPDNIVRKIIIDSLGTAWIGTEDAGLVNYNPSSAGFTQPITGKWSYGNISDMALDDDQIWMALPQSGLMRYSILSKEMEYYSSLEAAQLTSVKTIRIDRQKNLWIGSKSGIQVSQGDLIELIDLKGKWREQNVLAIAVDIHGITWFSTKEGLYKLRKDAKGNQQVERVPLATVPAQATIISLYADAVGNVWAGLYGEGVVLMDTRSGKTTHFLEELSNGSALNISGRGNHVWVSTLGGATLFSNKNGEWKSKNYTRAEGLASDYIYQVYIDTQERVWLATDREGIDMLDGKGFHHFKEGLASKAILGFAEDGLHQIWANVQGEGLFQRRDNAFRPFSHQGQLRENNIDILCTDRLGNLVMAHSAGIDVYDVRGNNFIYLGEESGIEDLVPNLNSVSIDQYGVISMGTEQGILRYSAKKSLNNMRPTPHIVGFRPLGQPDQPHGASFSYDENNLVVDYVGFWYTSPNDLYFQYMLEGYDKDWIISRDRSATYSRLPPGKFTFHLRVSTSDECNGVEEATYQIKISPPFWKTLWFYALSIGSIIFLGYSSIRYRERKLIKEKRILEKRVNERTLELQRKTEEIQAQSEKIQSQSEQIQGINENLEKLVQQRTRELERKNIALEEYAFINAHNLRAPVASVLGLINLIKRLELDEEGKMIVQHLQESATKLDSVVSSITQAIERGD